MSFKSKFLVKILIILLIATGVFFLISNREIAKNDFTIAESNELEEEKIILIIENSSEDLQQFELTTKEEITVFNLLKKMGIEFSYTEYDIGIFIDSIQNIKNDKDNGMYWMLYVNDKKSIRGASEEIVKPGDKIQWKYEKVNW